MGFSSFVARLLGTTVFAASAIGHITNFKQDAAWLAATVAKLGKVYGLPPVAAEITDGLLAVAIALLVLGSLLFGLGINERLGSMFLILFLLPVTPIMHAFWLASGQEQLLQLSQFLKNVTLLGLLLLVHYRSGYSGARHTSHGKKNN